MTQTKYLLIRGARQLLTLRGPSGPRRGSALRDLGIIEDGSVLISNGVVVEVGTSRRVENLAESRKAHVIDASGQVVMPGFVDSHTHLISGTPRMTDHEMRLAGAGEDAIRKAGGGFDATMREVRRNSARRREFWAAKAIQTFVRHGTTTIEAKSGYLLDQAGELKCLRTFNSLNGTIADIEPTYFGAHRVPPESSGSCEYLAWICAEMLPVIRSRKLARFVDIHCGPDGFSPEQCRKYLACAKQQGFLLKVHAQTKTHDEGVCVAVEAGAVSVDHLDHANTVDAALLARSNTVAALTPGILLGKAGRLPPARELIDHGAAVALATGFDSSIACTSNMQAVIAFACAQLRMTPAECVSAATVNGAHALRRAGQVGSIEYGKQADLLILDASDYRELSYWCGTNLVAITIKKGVPIYRAGEVVSLTD